MSLMHITRLVAGVCRECVWTRPRGAIELIKPRDLLPLLMSCTWNLSMKRYLNGVYVFKNILEAMGYASKTVDSKRGVDHSIDSLLDQGYHPLGRLPMWFRAFDHDRIKGTKRANRYLKFQEKRLKDAVIKGQYRKAVIVWVCLLKTSKVYQICLINKVFKGW